MIFQEPMSSLNPCFTVGFQIGEALKTHLDLDRRARAKRVVELLARGRHSRSGAPRARFPAPAFRRHEPAGDDRHGARLPAQAADRRRADDGARRDDPGADPRSAAVAQAAQRHGAGADHPRHGRRRRDRRPRHRAIRRPAGRGRTRRARLFADPHHPYTAALLAALPERATAAPAAGDSRRRARPVRPAAGLPVRAALRLRLRRLPPRRARPRRRRRSAAPCATRRSAAARRRRRGEGAAA